MNKPAPKVPFVISENNRTGTVCLDVDTLPHLVKAVKNADLDDIFLNHREGKSLNHMDLYVNPCYDATEVRAYLEALLTEAHEAWLASGGEEAESDTDVTKLQKLLTSAEATLGYYVDVLEEIKEAAKQGASLNYIIKVIENTLEPRKPQLLDATETDTAASDDSGSGE